MATPTDTPNWKQYEYCVVGIVPATQYTCEREYVYSLHTSLASAKAKIRWHWQLKQPNTLFTVEYQPILNTIT